MDQGPDSLSMLLAPAMVCLVALERWWRPTAPFWRHALALAMLGIGLLYFLHIWFGLGGLALDRGLVNRIGMSIMAVGTAGLFAWVIRVFVTDYRRATAERLAREAQPPS